MEDQRQALQFHNGKIQCQENQSKYNECNGKRHYVVSHITLPLQEPDEKQDQGNQYYGKYYRP